MFRSVIARTGVALSLSALVLGALAAPASAAVHTRWVDNDSKAGDGPTACDTASFHTIQALRNTHPERGYCTDSVLDLRELAIMLRIW